MHAPAPEGLAHALKVGLNAHRDAAPVGVEARVKVDLARTRSLKGDTGLPTHICIGAHKSECAVRIPGIDVEKHKARFGTDKETGLNIKSRHAIHAATRAAAVERRKIRIRVPAPATADIAA